MDEIVVRSEEEAELVLSEMRRILQAYGFVRRSEFFDLIGLIGSFKDVKVGWDNLDEARYSEVRGGFRFDLPETKPIAS